MICLKVLSQHSLGEGAEHHDNPEEIRTSNASKQSHKRTRQKRSMRDENRRETCFTERKLSPIIFQYITARMILFALGWGVALAHIQRYSRPRNTDQEGGGTMCHEE
jgi:hypothetical protein